MQTYTITIQETVVSKVEVEANDEEHARNLFYDGEVDYDDDDIVFKEIDEVSIKKVIEII